MQNEVEIRYQLDEFDKIKIWFLYKKREQELLVLQDIV